MADELKANRVGNWISEQVYFDELKENATYYLADPLQPLEKGYFVPPQYKEPNPLDPDALVWVMCEAWLRERYGYNPHCCKKPETVKGTNPAVAQFINRTLNYHR